MENQSKLRPGYPWRTAVVGCAIVLLFPWIFYGLDSIGSGGSSWARVQLAVINPMVFVVAVTRSWIRYGWKALLTVGLMTGAALISILVVYNSTALVFLVAYLVLSGLGIGVAVIVGRRRQ